MKPFLHILFFFIFLCVFSNCASGKKLQEEPPVKIKQPYYTSWTAGVKGAASGYNLFIPVEKGSVIDVDTVYFRGRKAVLKQDSEDSHLYIATFKIPSAEGKVPDLIMHEDPKKEYGNKPPVILEKMPFEMKNDEAAVRYTKNGKTKYFKITGIQKRDSSDVKIKMP